MPLESHELQQGVKLDTPAGPRTVGGTLQSGNGQWVVLVDEDGVGTLHAEGDLRDHEDVSVAEDEDEDEDKGKGKKTGPTETTEKTPSAPRPKKD